MNLSKELENIIRNNVKFDESAPWSYIVYLNKHIPHGRDALNRKITKIEKYAEKNNGYCKIKDDFRIAGDHLTVRIEMNCDCVAAKAFDAVVEEKARPYIYLYMNKDKNWSASMSADRPDSHAVRFCEEKEYPVELYYYKTDINGSSSVEMDVCENRSELIKSLNWLGECGFAPCKLWDFDLHTSCNEKVLSVFEAASVRRAELASNEWAFESLEDKITEAKDALLSSVKVPDATVRELGEDR